MQRITKSPLQTGSGPFARQYYMADHGLDNAAAFQLSPDLPDIHPTGLPGAADGQTGEGYDRTLTLLADGQDELTHPRAAYGSLRRT